MTIPATTTAGPVRPPTDRRLEHAVQQLEGVFVEQLFKAMRETVPDDGIISGGSGEEMFTGLMDQHLSMSVPGEWSSGLAHALLTRLNNNAPEVPTAPVPQTSP
jgi:peptidoglycan hydrolase FlgJ